MTSVFRLADMKEGNRITAVDLFAGAGGLSLGARHAGIQVTHAIENNHAAAETYRANHPTTTVLEDDIGRISPPKDLRKAQLLFGGPPCQGFSTSNQRTRTITNPRNWLFEEFFRFVSEIRPEWIVLENVKGLRETAKGKFEKMIQGKFRQYGYATTVWTLCSADFGVPQRRHRLFFIGRKKGKLPAAPMPPVCEPVTVRAAISDLPMLAVGASVNQLAYRTSKPSNYARQMRQSQITCTGHLVTKNNSLVKERYLHIPQGGNWTNIPAELMGNYTNLVNDRSRHTGIYRRLLWDEPSVVIANYRKNMLIHPEQHRGLSVREAARLQSFPDWYDFTGSLGFQQQQVGNAVPPLLATAVFKAILSVA